MTREPADERRPRVRPPDDDGPVLPAITRDELDEGWGDERESGSRDAAWYERERPPHHG